MAKQKTKEEVSAERDWLSPPSPEAERFIRESAVLAYGEAFARILDSGRTVAHMRAMAADTRQRVEVIVDVARRWDAAKEEREAPVVIGANGRWAVSR